MVEKTYAADAQLDVKALDGRFAGNIGLRYVRTDQTSSGFAADLTSLLVRRGGILTVVQRTSPVAIDNSYDEFLPTLNMSYDITGSLKARLALARTLTRPDLNLLTPSNNVDANVNAINSSNPQLKPYLSNQVDLSFEYTLCARG